MQFQFFLVEFTQCWGEQKVMAEFAAIEEVYTLVGLALLRNFLHIAGITC